jgi:hypothetical protein
MNPHPTLFDHLEMMKPLDRFHNTTNLSGDELKKREMRAGSQTRKILDFFRSHEYISWTAWEIQKAMDLQRTPITSVRRAISDLTHMGYLVKTDIKRVGEYGEECYAWRIK